MSRSKRILGIAGILVAIVALHFTVTPLLRLSLQSVLQGRASEVAQSRGTDIIHVALGEQSQPVCAQADAISTWLNLKEVPVSKQEFVYADPFEVQRVASFKRNLSQPEAADTIPVPLSFFLCQ